MKLEHLRFLKDEIAKDLDGEGVVFEVFYKYKNIWYLLDDSRVLSVAELAALEKTFSESVAYHTASSRTAWFGISSLQCVIALEFTTSPQIVKRKQYRSRLELVRTRAENSFKVSHNPLTLLLAKEAFYNSLAGVVKTSQTSNSSEVEETERAQSALLGVLAFDIDYFKQVNDTYGHLYGDQVLKVFALRLETVSIDIENSAEGRVKVVLGHPSGEEFLAYIVGNCSREEILVWADQFRAKIADEILPNASEWDQLVAAGGLSMLQLPPQQERSVRASVGVAFESSLNTTESNIDKAKFLLEQADTALYRAKAGGRNQVVAFDSILENYGRVLEQDADTKIVAIDIGSNVGVVLGQEFRVYSPNFTGKKKYQVSDGRTTRTLGTYPRVELTRITTFNVQPELSFAFISQIEDQSIAIQPGAHLEAIPVGSIGHILPYRSKYFAINRETGSDEDVLTLKNYLKEEVEKFKPKFSLVFRFLNDQDYLRKYGSAALNIALTQLYRDILSNLRFVGKAALLDASSIGVVGPEESYTQDLIEALIDNFYDEFPELGVIAGAYLPGDNEGLDAHYGVEFAQLAASPYGREVGSKVTHFSNRTAIRLLHGQYEARAYTSGQADFEKLVKLGVDDARILNYGGLLYSKAGMRKQAADQYEAAIAADPTRHIYKTNLAVVLNGIGEQERALKVFNSVPDDQMQKVIKHTPHAALIYTLLLAKAKLAQNNQNLKLSRFETLLKAVMSYDEEFKQSKKNIYDTLNSLLV